MCYSSTSIAATVLNGGPAPARAGVASAALHPVRRPAAWTVTARAVAIHASADAGSTVVGVLRQGQPFT
ncbi:hypothetical protein, partial [Streptomyces exfoliatus]